MRGLFAFFFALLLVVPVSAQQDNADVVAKVVRIQSAAVAIQDALPRQLDVGAEVQLGDVISTGKDARLTLEFTDGTSLTLGERAHFSVVEYVIGQNGGNAVFRMIEGAFQMTSGSMMQLADSSMTVETETATIGIRGTTFWGGALDSAFEVALIKGKGVYVETKIGRVELTEAGSGTSAPADNVFPSEPINWGEDKLNRAIATISYEN